MIWFLLHRNGVPTQQGNAASAEEAMMQGGEMGEVVLLDGPIADLKAVCVESGEVRSVPKPEVIVSSGEVNSERDRRIDSGVMFQGRHFQTRPDDRENVSGKSLAAFMAITNGALPGDIYWSGKTGPDGAPIPFVWISTDNTYVPMDAQTMVAFGTAVGDRKEALIFAASRIKKMAPIPLDYQADKYWP